MIGELYQTKLRKYLMKLEILNLVGIQKELVMQAKEKKY